MKPVERAELSAYLDGELPPDRAAEVRRAIAEDDSLRAAYEQLAVLDHQWTTLAARAAFHPRVRWATRAAGPPLAAAWLALALLMVRIAAKLGPPLVAGAIEVLALAAVIGWVVLQVVRTSDEDRWLARPGCAIGTS
jgi:anti-sigma factor RsiW